MNWLSCVGRKCLIRETHAIKLNVAQSGRISKISPLAAKCTSSHNSTWSKTLSSIQTLLVPGKHFWTLYKSKQIFLLSTFVLVRPLR